MDAICLEEWELLPDHKSSFVMEECGDDHGGVGGKDQLLLGSKLVMVDMDHFTAASHPAPYGCFVDEEAKKPLLPPSQDVHGSVTVTEFKDIGVVQTELERGEAMSKVTEIIISDTEEEEEVIKCPDGVKEVHQVETLAEAAAPVEDEGVKKIGFSVGNLRVHGVGALCSFGVAAATFCIFLLGGKQQHNRQNHKIQLQMYADDQRIQQVVQQASRLNQTMMSSVMGGASSPRASISFGGYYNGF
ncbi:hypothetical protein EJB05_03956 [Eragrostis curvula]|uniref:DUF6821 domain-containing protein n=1 Tax=Eragrostis curvula TaxID=38414 RepID=A0A5J9W738_9POAL|nr:hypothetical protein EJB05_03956 [Eragrostis curvula]